MVTIKRDGVDLLTPRQRLAHKLRDGRYRARLLGRVADLIPVSAVEHWLEDLRCYYCGCVLAGMYALEHKEPLVRGGGHTLDNIAPACLTCNENKHALTEGEFLDWTI